MEKPKSLGKSTLNELFPVGPRVAVAAIWDYTPERWECLKKINSPENTNSKIVLGLYHGKQALMWLLNPDEETRAKDEEEVMKWRRSEDEGSE